MLTDVIVARATPPGRSAVAVTRLSGDRALEVAGRVLEPFDLSSPRTMRRARIVNPGTAEVIDDVLYAVFPAPSSYTGQNVVEISSHGGAQVPSEVLEACLLAGARSAEPGEFTRRAVLNGKIDLLQAEGIGDLIDATAPAQRRAAIHQIERGLSRRIEGLRERVLGLEALICYEIDFPEEDDGPVPPAQIDAALTELQDAVQSLLASAVEGERLHEGALTVIAGRPNSGKSSLFNALLGSERAIVTEIAGTTRDAIEAGATCGGYPFRLVDTAGLRSTPDRIEQLGIEVSRRYLSAADLILFCVEAGRGLDPDEREFVESASAPVLLARTKVDVAPKAESSEGLPVSVVSGEGLNGLRAAMARAAFAELSVTPSLDAVVTRARQRVALSAARDELDAFRQAREDGVESLVAAVHLRAGVTALEDLIGVVHHDDVLDRVFATFCVGK